MVLVGHLGSFYKRALERKKNITGVHLEKNKTRALTYFKINQYRFLSVETAQIYILVWD